MMGKDGEGRGRTGEGRRVLVLDSYTGRLHICSNDAGLIIQCEVLWGNMGNTYHISVLLVTRIRRYFMN